MLRATIVLLIGIALFALGLGLFAWSISVIASMNVAYYECAGSGCFDEPIARAAIAMPFAIMATIGGILLTTLGLAMRSRLRGRTSFTPGSRPASSASTESAVTTPPGAPPGSSWPASTPSTIVASEPGPPPEGWLPRRALIEALTDTGVAINDRRLMSFELRIGDQAGAESRISHASLVPLDIAPSLKLGDSLNVRVDPARAGSLAIDWAASR